MLSVESIRKIIQHCENIIAIGEKEKEERQQEEEGKGKEKERERELEREKERGEVQRCLGILEREVENMGEMGGRNAILIAFKEFEGGVTILMEKVRGGRGGGGEGEGVEVLVKVKKSSEVCFCCFFVVVWDGFDLLLFVVFFFLTNITQTGINFYPGSYHLLPRLSLNFRPRRKGRKGGNRKGREQKEEKAKEIYVV